MSALEDKLILLNPLNATTIHDNVWLFKCNNSGSTITVDFNLFAEQHTQFFSTIKITFNQQVISLSSVELAKLLWLDMVVDYKPSSITFKSPFNGLSLLFAYLAETKDDRICGENLEDFLGFMLTYDNTNKGLDRRLSAPAYNSRMGVFSLINLSK